MYAYCWRPDEEKRFFSFFLSRPRRKTSESSTLERLPCQVFQNCVHNSVCEEANARVVGGARRRCTLLRVAGFLSGADGFNGGKGAALINGTLAALKGALEVCATKRTGATLSEPHEATPSLFQFSQTGERARCPVKGNAEVNERDYYYFHMAKSGAFGRSLVRRDRMSMSSFVLSFIHSLIQAVALIHPFDRRPFTC